MKMPRLASCFAYDNRNQLVGAVYPDGSSETFAYDPVGNRTRLVAVAPAGATTNTTTYTYATGNRLVADTSPRRRQFLRLRRRRTLDQPRRPW